MPADLVAMLQRSVEIAPDREAVCALGGERVAYRQFLDRAARVSGGLRGAGGKLLKPELRETTSWGEPVR